MSKQHRCHLCRHPGGPNRRINNRKPSCSCECHRPPEKPAPPAAEPKPAKEPGPKPRNSVNRKTS